MNAGDGTHAVSMGSNGRIVPTNRLYSAEPPSHRTNASRRIRRYEPRTWRVMKSASLASLVRRGLPGVRSHDSDASSRAFALLTITKQCFAGMNIAHLAKQITF